MQICPNCGEENPPRFRLCGFCGTPLAQALPQQEVRKTVTVVFVDLQGSTSLGERLDSESLREVLSRYFEVMRSVLQEYGGTVEKYIGDAIMAVFGLPRVHEDDALRAVLAAGAMNEALAVLNEELEHRWGVRLVNRTGVYTGEVVAGDPAAGQRLVSGDTVNVAARLEQAAPPLQVLIGESTYRLVRDAVDLVPVEPLELKGKTERVAAYRLIGARRGQARVRPSGAPLIGRGAELEVLLTTLREAQQQRQPRVVNLLGDPGVGKSRLAQELVAQATPWARILRGRCLSYGRGMTFGPLVDIVQQAAGLGDGDSSALSVHKLEALMPDAPDVVARLASAAGLGDTSFPLEEIYWASRKLFEALTADDRPLIVQIDDVHWAEPAFLDLIEYVGRQVAAPLLLVCSARPELLDLRPAWREIADWVRIDLQPLSKSESAQLVDSLLGTTDLPAVIHERVSRAAEGNPLFVEQLLAMLLDDGYIQHTDHGWHVTRDLTKLSMPGSIQALLAARVDQLTPEQRAIVEPASVIGQTFAEEALTELVLESLRPKLETLLDELVHKRLLQRAPEYSGGRWYRFQHALVQESAYQRVLKRTRASLHERFADWAERVNHGTDPATEHDEILGYHFEQAYGYLSELGPLNEHGRRLGERAATHLGGVGNRAFERGDMAAAANLLRRATALLPEGAPSRVALLPSLSEALMESGEFAAAEGLLDETIRTATERLDTRLLADAVFSRLLVRHHATQDLGAWSAEVERETARLIPLLEQQHADAELAKAWRMAAFVDGSVCRWQAVATDVMRAIDYARSAGQRRLEARLAAALAQALRDGPTPVPEAITRCEAVLASDLVDQQAVVLTSLHLAFLHALAGRLTTAREMYVQARERLADLGGGAVSVVVQTSLIVGRVELLADHAAEAAAELRRCFDTLGDMDEHYFRPLVGALLAHAVFNAGDLDQALALTIDVEAMAAPDDVEAQALWRSARARVLARHGRKREDEDEALQLAQHAVEVVASADAPVALADTLVDQAMVLMQARQTTAGRQALRSARALYLLKGATLPLHRTEALLTGFEALLPDGEANLAAAPEPGLGSASSRAVAD